MLTRDGRLIGNEEVQTILERGTPLNVNAFVPELLKFDHSEATDNVLLNLNHEPISSGNMFNFTSDLNQCVSRHGLESLDFSVDARQSEATPILVDMDLTSSTVPSTPSIQSSPMLPALTYTPYVEFSRTNVPSRIPSSRLLHDPLLLPRLEPTQPEDDSGRSDKLPPTPRPLLDLSTTPVDLAGLMSFQPNSLGELAGLDFQLSDTVEGHEEAIVFQGRHSRKSSERTIIDPGMEDRAFRMFSQGVIKSQK